MTGPLLTTTKRSTLTHKRGRAYLEICEYDRAITDFSKAIEIEPEYERAYVFRGIAYLKIGDKARCGADTRRATELSNRQLHRTP
jgi:Tfp pilus assembly protein PilF